MTMERYDYDQPVGVYGFESKERLADSVIRDCSRYSQMMTGLEEASICHGADDMNVDYFDDFRLSNLVVEQDPVAHALAVMPVDDDERRGIQGRYYAINLGSISVTGEPKDFFVTHPDTQTSRLHQKETKSLVSRFEKPELEAVMRMMGKLTTGLAAAEQIPRHALE